MKMVVLVYVPCPSLEVAQKLATMALEHALVGCVNMWPITSMYRHDGVIKTDREVILLIKTVSSCVDLLVALLKQNHPYTTPCIITSQGLCNESYAQWLQEACKP